MSDFNLNKDGSFMSEGEIVDDIIANRTEKQMRRIIGYNFDPPLTAEEREAFLKTRFNAYHFMRSEFGRWIRNSYGLWDKANPYTVPDPEPNADGVLDHPRHPDNITGRIINELVRRLRLPEKPAL